MAEIESKLKQKLSGSRSGRNGFVYEVVYAAEMVCFGLEEILGMSSIDYAAYSRCFFNRYPRSFIDDLHLSQGKNSFFAQLKSGDAKKSTLLSDFQKQAKLDNINKSYYKYKVVMSDQNLLNRARTWLESVPLDIEFDIFRFEGNIRTYLLDRVDIRNALQSITCSSEFSVINCAYRIIYSEISCEDDARYLLSLLYELDSLKVDIIHNLLAKAENTLSGCEIDFVGNVLRARCGTLETAYLCPASRQRINRTVSRIETEAQLDYFGLVAILEEEEWREIIPDTLGEAVRLSESMER